MSLYIHLPARCEWLLIHDYCTGGFVLVIGGRRRGTHRTLGDKTRLFADKGCDLIFQEIQKRLKEIIDIGYQNFRELDKAME